MTSSNEKKRVTTMRLPKDMIERLDGVATELDWSRTTLVTQALAKFLAERGQPTSVRVVL